MAEPDGTQAERDFLAQYDPRAFDPIAVTVDVVALTLRAGRLHVLAVERGGQPFAGRWALPGGFVRAGRESLDEAAARELAEETGLDAAALDRVHLEQLGSYGSPHRDPRMHVVSVAYLAFAPGLPDAQPGGDAAGAGWLPVEAISPAGQPDEARPRPFEQGRRTGAYGGGAGRRPGHDGSGGLAFDHGRILADGLERARAKIEYTPLATAFLGESFTITELREVYETVWGAALHAGNFHRKVLSVPGFVESTGETDTRPGSRGGPRARLYRAGDARLLHPALLRPDREAGVR
ncbi:NUDIX domain-containing protein [Streptomyces cocklensis]|jgi:8-oxo-dGTP diphosphatase|uniref:8-oxo-dGTP diphosphatase n=1 Tax=Actinacidiphila cocklensis TaxID=887465 RepID=A0A9W4GPU2_9ACTN|nr:NUDIX domain-containing protein [Actinacidiphila cocklensis]MDD1063838.1 NUDIX domain-containing protein [Actinacidiphila cocklensis]WSX73116.1 NUDIX domain-containing protein [Streptomyces sp. NBC_00899]WSX80818.1 NUDIX domain-containing protein [Streptomyces sp. NBC_00899]CAG6392607.1 8-oxo-dGTP diphosphatase [Actinacidiphila cocklensis]